MTPEEALLDIIYHVGSQELLAERLNVTQPTISYWLRTKVPPTRLNELLEASDHLVTKHDLRPDLYD